MSLLRRSLQSCAILLTYPHAQKSFGWSQEIGSSKSESLESKLDLGFGILESVQQLAFRIVLDEDTNLLTFSSRTRLPVRHVLNRILRLEGLLADVTTHDGGIC